MKFKSNPRSLHILNPELSKQWHPILNDKLSTKDVTIWSNKKVWWYCAQGHEWKAKINSRQSGTGCPYCSGLLATEKNNLEVSNPDLAKEWHPIKNGYLKPTDVLPNSGKKVWWICKKGHSWKAAIYGRNRSNGCPYCSGLLATEKNNLEVSNPDLAKEWHPTKNLNLNPKIVTVGSSKKVWWCCDEGHEWQATINNRNRGTRCPYCVKKLSHPKS